MDEERAKQVLFDLNQKEKELQQLQRELRLLGGYYSQLGLKLREKPEDVIFPGQEFSTEYLNVGTMDVPSDAFSKEKLEEKTKYIRELIENVRNLNRKKSELGL